MFACKEVSPDKDQSQLGERGLLDNAQTSDEMICHYTILQAIRELTLDQQLECLWQLLHFEGSYAISKQEFGCVQGKEFEFHVWLQSEDLV